LKIFGDHSVHKISSPKNHKVNEKISGWPLCQKYLWHFLPLVKKSEAHRGAPEVLGDERTYWVGPRKC
jgi:hypothetical protein